MRYVLLFLIVATIGLSPVTLKASEADALAEAGISFISMGKVDKGRDILYRALAHDENCPLAIYELGKLFQAEGNNISAVDFLTKTIVLMQNVSKPEYTSMINDAKARLQTLNPYAGHFTQVFEEYAQNLGQICNKSNDTATCTEALNRVHCLNMAAYLPADKMPNIPKPSKPVPPAPVKNTTTSAAPTSVPLEVERTLKAAGWTTITGTWKKKSEGVYEVTDGKLEAPKINGGIKLVVDQGGSGSVSAFVRNAQKDPTKAKGMMGGSSMLGSMTSATGFGVTIANDLSCKVFAPQGINMNADINFSFLEHTTTLVNLPRHEVMITVKDSELHIVVDGKKEKNSFAKLNKDGPFTVEVKGTMTIEDPKAAEY